MRIARTDEQRKLAQEIGRRIRARRVKLHMTQTALAAATGFNQGHLSQMEHGNRLPSVLDLHQVAEALGVDMGMLLPPRSGDGERGGAS